VQQNVIVHLSGQTVTRKEITSQIRQFCGYKPEIWAWYSSYDWVALCQLFGTMMEIPAHWPKYCRDAKQLCDDLGNPPLPKQEIGAHHALADAKWVRETWIHLMSIKETRVTVGLIE
jgi:3' exoribonuclease, RNase T-like